jgi:amino acid permease
MVSFLGCGDPAANFGPGAAVIYWVIEGVKLYSLLNEPMGQMRTAGL